MNKKELDSFVLQACQKVILKHGLNSVTDWRIICEVKANVMEAIVETNPELTSKELCWCRNRIDDYERMLIFGKLI